MSEIRDMNKEIRSHAMWGGIGVALLAATAIAPDAIADAFRGEFKKELWWLLLTAGFAALARILEGTGLGRTSPHRTKVDLAIARGVVRQACSRGDCPQRDAPSNRTRDRARNVFYKLIDQPSREVAFHYWGWYYTSLIWIALAATAVAVSAVASFWVSTDRDGIRAASIAAQVGLLLLAVYIRSVWSRRTARHANAQVDQIAPEIPGTLTSVTCGHPECPLR